MTPKQMTNESSITHHPSSIERICPYPGLRAFEEEESLYFKGRERPIDEIMEKLAAKKFLLLTGASGDGKSSLIFAGLVPNCRAGFFKAKFNNWAIVSFRPERAPLKNLAAALAPHLVNSASSTQSTSSAVENSLKYGYAALIDLYKESSLFLDTNGTEWSNAGDEERKGMKRNASNLLIIVDQFEEFFTNSENFNRETSTATESTQVMGSLLLETARLAQEQDIPIYIVCTMRSDYLGQCAALSGFPEKIEECLFYLPRLKRQDIVMVIEEPATLSGNSISERLIQRLLNDTHAGIDILPVLQHCLHRIWLAADRGNGQMDLIHYAMVGGMTGDQLPEEDRQRFEKWFGSLPGYKRALFATASLENVLNIHANELYVTAGQTSNASGEDDGDIIKSDARFIIETTFKCLTKIDDNRAIRNLMTIDEITEMLGKDKYTIEQVEEVIKPFRMQGNTFIRPFITDKLETFQPKADQPLAENLKPETVHDITHEALIRNWKRLNDWAWEEHQNVQTYREFRAQLDKWLKNNRKKEHLMSVGSLNYFGTWFEAQKTNPVAWLKRYMWEDEEVEDMGRSPITQKLSRSELDEKAKEHFGDIREYLNLSRKNIARKTRIARIAVAAICILLVLVSFAWFRSEKLNKLISKTKHANEIATKAYLKLENDPTLAFRLAEQAYNIEPTDLSRQVIMASYGVMPFYKKLEGHTSQVTHARFTPNGKFVITTGYSDNTIRIWNIKGELLHILKGHSGILAHGNEGTINISSDSKYIISASSDSTARLWDLEGNCLAVMKHDGAVSSAVFGPPPGPLLKTGGGEPTLMDPGGKDYLILTASSDKTARLWQFKSPFQEGGSPDLSGQGDVAGRKSNPPLLQPTITFKGHTKGLRLAKFSPNGKHILTVAGDTTARIWNLEGKQLHVLKGHKKRLYDATFSPDGKLIGTSGFDNTAKIWGINGKLIHTLKGHDDLVATILFSPDMTKISTTSDDLTIKLWDLDGKEMTTMRGHKATIWSTKFSPNGKYIITASDDGTARLWDLNGTELMVLKGHADQILSANFSPDGKYVVTASSDQTARIWNIQPEENPIFKGHTAWVVDANFSPDGKYIVTAGWDYMVRLWTWSGEIIKVLKGHTGYSINIANFSPDMKYIYSAGGSSDPTIRIWDYNNGKELKVLKGHKTFINNAIVSSDGNFILSYSKDNTARLWNNNGDSLHVFENTSSAEFSPDGNYIATLSTDSSLYFWRMSRATAQSGDTAAGPYKQIHRLRIPGTAFTSAEFSPDGKWFLTTSEDSTARLWQFKSPFFEGGKSAKGGQGDVAGRVTTAHQGDSSLTLGMTGAIKHPAQLTLIRFSPNGKYFLTAAQDNIIRIYDIDDIAGKSEGLTSPEVEGTGVGLLGHTDAINDANFSKDSKYIVTGSNDFTVRVWDLNGNELQMLTGHKAAITTAKFSADGKYILTASNDHTAMLMPWRVEDVLRKINAEKVRGEVWELSEEDKKLYGIIE